MCGLTCCSPWPGECHLVVSKIQSISRSKIHKCDNCTPGCSIIRHHFKYLGILTSYIAQSSTPCTRQEGRRREIPRQSGRNPQVIGRRQESRSRMKSVCEIRYSHQVSLPDDWSPDNYGSITHQQGNLPDDLLTRNSSVTSRYVRPATGSDGPDTPTKKIIGYYGYMCAANLGCRHVRKYEYLR
ncbi:hypothetical protein IF1G_08893 [Cordyceps javanica]|uniref:Uncharacterized protein n=1 Tax=Cordyceps javanica TaxID=43265 RepID=A0A545USF3_9HYPO|nr:hypothetical protein IF1G_08893 [Cordyceps javanica]